MGQWAALVSEMKYYARSRSPTLKGRPTAPTADVRDSSEQIANTAYVEAKLDDWFSHLPGASYEVVRGEEE